MRRWSSSSVSIGKPVTKAFSADANSAVMSGEVPAFGVRSAALRLA